MSLNFNQREYTFTAEDGAEKTLKYALVPAKQGLAIATKLSEVMTVFFEGGFTITSLIEKITQNVDIFELATVLFKGATIDRGDGNDFPLKPDEYFAGNYGELIDCIADALEKNFGSFFKAKALSMMSNLSHQI